MSQWAQENTQKDFYWQDVTELMRMQINQIGNETRPGYGYAGVGCAFYTMTHVFQGNILEISFVGLSLASPVVFSPLLPENTSGGCVIKSSTRKIHSYCEIDCSVVSCFSHQLNLQFKSLNEQQLQFIRSLMQSHSLHHDVSSSTP